MIKLMQESESEVMRKKERRGVCAFAGERVCVFVCVRDRLRERENVRACFVRESDCSRICGCVCV